MTIPESASVLVEGKKLEFRRRGTHPVSAEYARTVAFDGVEHCLSPNTGGGTALDVYLLETKSGRKFLQLSDHLATFYLDVEANELLLQCEFCGVEFVGKATSADPVTGVSGGGDPARPREASLTVDGNKASLLDAVITNPHVAYLGKFRGSTGNLIFDSKSHPNETTDLELVRENIEFTIERKLNGGFGIEAE